MSASIQLRCFFSTPAVRPPAAKHLMNYSSVTATDEMGGNSTAGQRSTPPTHAADQRLRVRVHGRRLVSDRVVMLELLPVEGSSLPTFTAGAHIAVEVAGVGVRHYSLCNDPAEADRYCIAIARHAQSTGGSAHMHDAIHEGDLLKIGLPRNNFPLWEEAPRSVLIAGGIGVTPLVAMARRLTYLGKPWIFYYCTQRPEQAPFLQDLMSLGGTVVPVFDGVPGVTSLNLAAVFAAAGRDDHLYCCGPQGLMRAFDKAGKSRPANTVHVEWFSPPNDDPLGASSAFDVTLARSNRVVHVPAGKSILDALLEADVAVPFSCGEGLCGTCECKVLDGSVDHRDFVLTDAEKANGRILTCVSRSRSGRLVLDL
jgi:ferredoxin-NADP reductase